MKKKTKVNEAKTPAVVVGPAQFNAKPLAYEVLYDRKLNLTAERAYQFLELATFEGERTVIERHVQSLYNCHVGGRFMWDHVIIATCRCEGVVYRINGQHTCWMRVNITEPVEANVRWIEYSVEDQEHLRSLYSTFDQAKMRSPGHIVKALLAGTETCQEIWPSLLNVLSSGMRVWLYELAEHRQRLKAPDLAELISNKYHRQVHGVAMFIQSRDRTEFNFMRRAAVIASMMATFEAAPNKFMEFWEPVSTGVGLETKTDPRFQLRRWLEGHSQSIMSRLAGKETASQEDTYRVCIQSWNKWRRGETIGHTIRPNDRRTKAI